MTFGDWCEVSAMSDRTPSFLFVCVGNAGSQMAEALADRLGMRAASAGTLPSKSVNPVVVQEMKEKGIVISSNKPKMLCPRPWSRSQMR